MKRTHTLMVGLCATGAFAAAASLGPRAISLGAPVSSPMGAAQQVVSSGPPPPALRGADKSAVPFPINNPEIKNRVSYDTLGKYVTVKWTAKNGNQWSVIASQDEPVLYWPTEVAYFGANKILVAGKRDARGKHKTVIEIWEFDQVGDVPAIVTDEYGRQSYTPFSVPILSKTVVYDAAAAGRDMVRTMFRFEGTAGSVLIHFWDSNDLYSLDTSTQAVELVLASAIGSGAEVQPALANPYTDRWSAEHNTHGYIYVLVADQNTPEGVHDPLVLYDGDKNGTLDPGTSTTVSDSNWASQGFGSANQYVRFFFKL